MVYYSDLIKFFPPVIKFPGKSIYDETNLAYNLNKSEMPLKTPPVGEIYNYEILEQLQLVREDLHKNQTEDELKQKLVTLYENWGPSNLNILNSNCIKTIFEIVNKIDKKKEVMHELVALAETLNTATNKNQEIKPKVGKYDKDINEIISQMKNVSTSINSKQIEEKEDQKLSNLLELLKIDNERIKKQTDFYKPV